MEKLSLKISNNKALVLFSILFIFTAYSWLKVLSLGGDVSNVSQLEARFLIITGLFFIPTTLLGMLVMLKNSDKKFMESYR